MPWHRRRTVKMLRAKEVQHCGIESEVFPSLETAPAGRKEVVKFWPS
jgi:hypothetical protein